jgi:hypothetical protein
MLAGERETWQRLGLDYVAAGRDIGQLTLWICDELGVAFEREVWGGSGELLRCEEGACCDTSGPNAKQDAHIECVLLASY